MRRFCPPWAAAAIALVALSALTALPATAAADVDEQQLVVSIAEAQIGKGFRIGMEGPRLFDCSGLVYFVFSNAGLLDRIGGERRLANEYYKWARERGLVSKTDPRVGDLVLWRYRWSSRVKHIGIYVGTNANGKPMAISALTTGVTRHRVGRISIPFFAYIHTGLRALERPTPTPTPPTPTPPTPTPPTPTPIPPTPTPPTPTPTPTHTPLPTLDPSPSPSPTVSP